MERPADRGPRRRERGAGGLSLGWVIAMPAALLLLFGGVQFALQSYAGNLALSAAQAGVRAASAYPANADRGKTAARDFITDHAGDSLENGAVSITIADGLVRVVVTGHAQSIVPGLSFDVSEEAAGPAEVIQG